MNPDDTNTIIIPGYTISGGTVNISTNINNLLVTGVGNGNCAGFGTSGNSVFAGNATGVTIAGGVASIGSSYLSETIVAVCYFLEKRTRMGRIPMPD